MVVTTCVCHFQTLPPESNFGHLTVIIIVDTEVKSFIAIAPELLFCLKQNCQLKKLSIERERRAILKDSKDTTQWLLCSLLYCLLYMTTVICSVTQLSLSIALFSPKRIISSSDNWVG